MANTNPKARKKTRMKSAALSVRMILPVVCGAVRTRLELPLHPLEPLADHPQNKSETQYRPAHLKAPPACPERSRRGKAGYKLKSPAW